MRRLRRGKPIEPQYTVHQFANDWIAAEGTSQIFRPSQVQLDPEDLPVFQQAQHVGCFWEMWRLGDDGRFTRIEGSGV
jgi:hypothetical protein